MKRLAEELPDGFEASLVKAGQGGEPSEARRARALEAALGVLAAGSAVPLTTAAGGALAAAKPTGTAVLLGLGWKVWAVSAVVGVAALGGAVFVAQRAERTPRPTPAAPAVRSSAEAPPVAAPSAPPGLAVPTAMASAPRVVPVAAPTAAPRAAPAPPAESDLGAEVSAIDGVRAALDAHRGTDALRLLDAYAAQHPNGSLTREAELLRIEALVLVGDREGAVRRAHVLEAAPGSAGGLYRARLRKILE